MKLKELQKTAKNLLGIDILASKKEMEYSKERKIELLFKGQYKGYEFYVLNLGTHPTAYVKLPEGHKYYNKHYDEIDIDIDVHGGLTYSDDFLLYGEGIATGWIIGWDYAHYNDYAGYYTTEGYEKWTEQLKKWTTDEMIQDCIDVIEQLSEMK